VVIDYHKIINKMNLNYFILLNNIEDVQKLIEFFKKYNIFYKQLTQIGFHINKNILESKIFDKNNIKLYLDFDYRVKPH
jgi:hypothetical protein